MGLQNIDEGKEKMIFDYIRRIPEVFYVVSSLGLWELEVDLEVKDSEGFRKIITELTNKFSGFIIDYTALQIYDIHKYNLFS